MTLRFGVLGTGNMAGVHAAELRALEPFGVELAAVGSRTLSQARDFASRHGIARCHGSYEALALDPDIDVIYIATPPVLHEQNALLCLNAGKHVLCEKPFAINAPAADRMIACAGARGLFLMEAMWTRFLPAMRAVRRLIQEGAIGRLRLISGGGAFIPSGGAQGYLLRHELGGGVLLDAGVYYVSLASAFAGPALAVKSVGVLGASCVDEQDAWLSEHGEGVQAMCYVSLRARRPPELEIIGDRGRILLHAPVFCPTRLTVSRVDQSAEIEEHPIERSGYGYQVLELRRCVNLGLRESPLLPLAESRSVLATMDDIRSQLGLCYPGE